MQKITLAKVKRMARQQFRADGGGIVIRIIPNKIRPDNMWVEPLPIRITADKDGSLFVGWNDNSEPFEQFMNRYTTHNCFPDTSRNKGVHYYMKERATL
jgi:hypothetical protein